MRLHVLPFCRFALRQPCEVRWYGSGMARRSSFHGPGYYWCQRWRQLPQRVAKLYYTNHVPFCCGVEKHGAGSASESMRRRSHSELGLLINENSSFILLAFRFILDYKTIFNSNHVLNKWLIFILDLTNNKVSYWDLYHRLSTLKTHWSLWVFNSKFVIMHYFCPKF